MWDSVNPSDLISNSCPCCSLHASHTDTSSNVPDTLGPWGQGNNCSSCLTNTPFVYQQGESLHLLHFFVQMPPLPSADILLQPPYLDLDVHLLFTPAFSPSEHIEPVPSFPLYLAPCPAATPHPQSSLLHLASSSYCNNFLAGLPDSSLSPSIQLVQVARLIFPNTAFIKSLANSSTPTAFCIHSKCLHLALRASHLLPSFF